MSFSLTPHIHLTILSLLAEVPAHFLSLQARSQWCHQGGKLPPLWVDVQKLCNVCAFIVMELLRNTRQIHCKAVKQRATLIHRQYNRDWGTSYSRPPIDPYLTSPLLQNPGGATALAAKFHIEPHDVVRSSVARIKDSLRFYFSNLF